MCLMMPHEGSLLGSVSNSLLVGVSELERLVVSLMTLSKSTSS